jgi:hypothetical protein
MKKILLLLVGVLTFLSANAYTDLYLRGDWTKDMSGLTDQSSSAGWGYGDANKMTTTDGVHYYIYNVSMTKGQAFKVANSNWNNSVNDASTTYGAYNEYELKRGENYGVKTGTGSSNFKAADDYNNVTVAFNSSTKKLYIASPDQDFYYFSNTTGWSANDTYKMSTSDGITYTLNGVTLTKDNVGFLIAISGMSVKYSNCSNVGMGTNQLTCGATDNNYLSSTLSNVNLTFDGFAETLTITNPDTYKYGLWSQSDNKWLVDAKEATDGTVSFTYSRTTPISAGGKLVRIRRVMTPGAGGDDVTTDYGTDAEYYFGKEYNGVTLVENKNITLAYALMGDINFSVNVSDENVPTAVTITGGQTAAYYDYTIYYYRPETDTDALGVHAYTSQDIYKDKWGDTNEEGMTKVADRYKLIDGVYYALYAYNIHWYTEPETLIFWTKNDQNTVSKQAEDCSFSNNGIYTKGEKSPTSYTVDDFGPKQVLYKLHTNLGTDADSQDILLNSDNSYTYTYTFDGNESGKYVAMTIDGAAYGVANGAEYNGTETTYTMTATDNGNITFKSGLTGEVKLVFNPDNNELTISGGEVYVKDVVLYGSFNEWKNNDASYKMTQSDNTYTYTFSNKVDAGTTFAVKTAEDNTDCVWMGAANCSYTETSSDATQGEFVEAYTVTVTRDGKSASFDAVVPGTYDGLSPNAFVYSENGTELGMISKDAEGHYVGTLAKAISDETADFTFRIKFMITGADLYTKYITAPAPSSATEVEATLGETLTTAKLTADATLVPFKVTENLKSAKVTFVRNDKGTSTVTLEGEHQDFYVVGTFTEWKTNDSYKFSTTNGIDYTYTLTSDVSSPEFKINSGDWHSDSNAAAIDFGVESGKTYAIDQVFNLQKNQSDNNIKFSNTFEKGTQFIFTYLASTGTSTLLIKTPEKVEQTYTVYFYDTTSKLTSVSAYTWAKGSSDENAAYPGVAMTETGKYVAIGGNYYPVWSYQQTTYTEPEFVIFNNGNSGDENKLTTTTKCEFVDGGFYHNQSNVATTGLTLVDLDDDNYTYFYFHWKEDYISKGKDLPRCHVYSSTSDATAGTLNNDNEKMELVSDAYQIYRFKVLAAQLNAYDRVTFYYKDSDGNFSDSYKYTASKSGDDWDQYIYTTAETEDHVKYAVQSYISYQKFTELAAKGYENLYVVGGSCSGTGASMKMRVSSDDTEGTTLAWDPTAAVAIAADSAEDPCFYFHLIPTITSVGSANGWGAGFKISWINVNELAPKEGASDDRDWATYDLGIIGVDDVKCSDNTDWGNTVELNSDKQHVYFFLNKSLPILLYNQYSWVVNNGSKFNFTSGTDYYCVVDLHPGCQTVTMTSFHPQPSVDVTAETTKMENSLTADDIADIEFDTFMAVGEYLKKYDVANVNTAKGEATITAASNSDVESADFSREYRLYINDELVAKYTGSTAKLSMDNMPLASNNDDVKVRAKYTDNKTALSFHSRYSTSTVKINGVSTSSSTPSAADAAEASKTPVAPEKADIYNSKYICEGVDGTNLVYGIYFELRSFNVTNAPDLYYYEDLDVSVKYSDTGETVKKNVEILTTDCDTYKYINGYDETTQICSYQTVEGLSEKIDDNTNWSSTMSSIDYQGGKVLPLFIHNVRTVASAKDLTTNDIVNCDVYAVYPFLWNPNATITASSSTSSQNAPRRRDNEVTSYAGYKVSNTNVGTHSDTNVTEVISGVESVAADQDLNAPVEYYTISGIRVVGTPAPGIYIRRQGNTVSKVAIR